MSPRPGSKAVIDASVALKWLLDDEECVREALSLRDDSLSGSLDVSTPTLMMYEAINGLVVASRRGRFPPQEVPEAMGDLLTVGVTAKTPDHHKISGLAMAHDVTAYDSAYLALAEQEECELWTGDRQLYDSVNKRLKWVRWIGDYPTHRRARGAPKR